MGTSYYMPLSSSSESEQSSSHIGNVWLNSVFFLDFSGGVFTL